MTLAKAPLLSRGIILGVEGLEGSDQLILRSKDLRLPGAAKGVLVKVIKPGQDTRVDRSVIGPETVKNAHKAGLAGIAAESGHVILLDAEKTIALANEKNIFIVGISYDIQD